MPNQIYERECPAGCYMGTKCLAALKIHKKEPALGDFETCPYTAGSGLAGKSMSDCIRAKQINVVVAESRRISTQSALETA